MNNRKNMHFRPAVFIVRINASIADEWFEIDVMVDDITNNFKITSIARYIFSTANNVMGQSIRRVNEPDIIVWLLLRSIPDLDSVDIVDTVPPAIAFLPERKGGVKLYHILASPLCFAKKVPTA